MRTKSVWLGCLALGFLAIGELGAQSAPQVSGEARTNAQTFLDGVLKRYSEAKTYHIELVEESNFNTDLKRTWERRSMKAVMLPDKRYHFEVHHELGWLTQMSDGVSEWVYAQQISQYTKEPAPISFPGPMPNIRSSFGLNYLLEARRMLGRISGPRGWIRSATYLPDETIDVNGHSVLCTVVEGKGMIPGLAGAERKILSTLTFWIDKRDGAIWKEIEHRNGPMYPEMPRNEYTLERTTWFNASELNAQSAPKELFVFMPKEGDELVKTFESPRDRKVRGLEGEQVRVVDLGLQNGKTLSLASFLGKPVLLDFWATWCVPCVESLPEVKKLYDETADKGLVVLSIDDDEDARTATDFLAKHNEPWSNFHLTSQIAAAFPEHAIPYFVLVDASGKIVYSYQGLDESALRAAVRKLGPEFAGVSETSLPRP
jgi:thiol-disulfide isomerase/thioredoxin